MCRSCFTSLFLITEWFHPTPFIKLQLLARRNLGLGFCVFFVLLTVLASAVVLPSNLLAHSQGFRLAQTSMIGLIVGLPQLILGSVVALLIYQKWVDARYLFATGLALIATACWLASHITSDWMIAQFLPAEILQMLGQPLAVVSMLFLATSVVQPMEGPYIAGIVNTIRAFGAVFGGSIVNQYLTYKSKIHNEYLIDQTALHHTAIAQEPSQIAQLANELVLQANILATADLYRIFTIADSLCFKFAIYPLTTCQYCKESTITCTSTDGFNNCTFNTPKLTRFSHISVLGIPYEQSICI